MGNLQRIQDRPNQYAEEQAYQPAQEDQGRGGITDHPYKNMYPKGAVATKFYRLPKIHKRDILLRPIMSSRGSIYYEVANELVRILRPLVGNSPQHIVILYNKLKGSLYKPMNVLLHMMSLHYLHLCL